MNEYNVLKYGATGVAAPDMTAYDKMRTLAMAGGAKYPVTTVTGVPPIRFRSDGSPLISWSMKGNGQQTGTPTPDAPIMPEFVGTLDSGRWTVPISCSGQNVTADLSQVQTVRRVQKLALTGEEDWVFIAGAVSGGEYYRFKVGPVYSVVTNAGEICTHYQNKTISSSSNDIGFSMQNSTGYDGAFAAFRPYAISWESELPTWKAYLATQYANGTPVTLWYAITEPETAIVNEPLAKIGDYADELHSADAGVTIPAAKGINTLTVDTDLQPSEISITGYIKPL